MVKIAIAGAAGRMGRQIAALAIESEQFDIVCALEAPGHEALGKDVGELAGVGAFGVKLTAELTGQPRVLLDFTCPEATLSRLDVCRRRRIAMVIGTTGLSESHLAAVADAARDIPILQSANMSVGINVLLKILPQVARALGSEFDIEISETHHRFKKDAPSGTAIMLAKAICAATGKEYAQTAIFGRGGQCPRKPGEIGMHALRLGDTVGEHTVYFGSLGETLAIRHSAHAREMFARGALKAAAWLPTQKPGLYSMFDVLGIS